MDSNKKVYNPEGFSVWLTENESIVNPSFSQYYLCEAKVLKGRTSSIHGLYLSKNPIFQCFTSWFGPKMWIFRTGNESINKPTIPQYYNGPVKLVKTHKSSVKIFSIYRKTWFTSVLPPYLGQKCACLESEEPIINLSVHQYYFSRAKVFYAQKSFVKNDPWALFVKKPNFSVFLPSWFGPKMCIFRTRNDSTASIISIRQSGQNPWKFE